MLNWVGMGADVVGVGGSSRARRGTGADASAAAARDRRADRGTQTARTRRRRWAPMPWTFATGWGRSSVPACAAGARSGRGWCGRLGRGSRRASPSRRVTERNTAGSVPALKIKTEGCFRTDVGKIGALTVKTFLGTGSNDG